MAGYRSLLAFWTGGAAGVAPTTERGFRSLLAFWSGGAANLGDFVPPVVTEEQEPAGRKRQQQRRKIVIDDQIYDVTPDELVQLIEVRAKRIARNKRALPKPIREQVLPSAEPAVRVQAYISHVRHEVASSQWALDAMALVDAQSIIDSLNAATLRYVEEQLDDEETFVYLLTMMV